MNFGLKKEIEAYFNIFIYKTSYGYDIYNTKNNVERDNIRDIDSLIATCNNEGSLFMYLSDNYHELRGLIEHRRQYLDNGYGIHTTVDIEIYRDENGDITKILIDGMDADQLQEELNKVVSECEYQKLHEGCGYGDNRYEIEDQINEDKEYNCNCQDCEMLASMVVLESSLWWE